MNAWLGHGRERLAGVAGETGAALDALARQDASRRLWAKDHTLWQEDPVEVADRLGWLDCPDDVEAKTAELDAFMTQVRADGFTHAVVLGMGGSSLFPEVLTRIWGEAGASAPAGGGERRGAAGASAPADGLELRVLDTTDPAAIRRLERELPLERTLFIASSKSGTTIETRSHLEYFWEASGKAPARFCVVTDPGSDLERLARERGFRAVWLADPAIGGRYSALSWFGLVPARLIGVDAAELLHRAGEAAAAAGAGVPPADNPAMRLAAAIGAATATGRDKLTLVLPGWAAAFGLWVEQLVAESLGKRGRGVLPVVGEALGPPGSYGEDRLFVSFGAGGDALDALAAAGHPVVELAFDAPVDIGAEVFRWEAATALIGALLDINPFDQPNVAQAKNATATALAEGLPAVEPTRAADLLALIGPGDYLAIQAYIDPASPDLAAIEEARLRLRDRHRVATTVGLGPRFLHSTGQLHKGGPPSGVFVQILGEDAEDTPIPGQPYGFSVLKQAQAAGDLATLRALGRRAGRVRLEDLLKEAAP